MSIADVRPATFDDVPEIARIQQETWNAAYSDVLGPGVVAALDRDDLGRRWTEAIEHPDTTISLATEDQLPVGFCVAGPAPEDEISAADGTPPSDAEAVGLIATLLVEPRWGRRGHGGRLLATAAAELRNRGAERGITWVAESDSATLSFFRGVGWHPDRVIRTLDTGERTLRELRLTGSLELHLE